MCAGTLPREWGQIKTLTNLSIGSSNLTGSIPESWTNLTNLYDLGISNTNLSGTLPESFGESMTQLTFAYLFLNKFSDIDVAAASQADASQWYRCGPVRLVQGL